MSRYPTCAGVVMAVAFHVVAKAVHHVHVRPGRRIEALATGEEMLHHGVHQAADQVRLKGQFHDA